MVGNVDGTCRNRSQSHLSMTYGTTPSDLAESAPGGRSDVMSFDQKGFLLTTMSDNTSFVLQTVGQVSYDQRSIPESGACSIAIRGHP